MNSIIRKIALYIIDKFDHVDMRNRRKFIEKHYGIKIGKYTYGYDLRDIAKGTSIGSFCSIARGVKVGQMNHPTDYVSSHPFLYYSNRGFLTENKELEKKSSVVIEDDVWIGNNAILLPGVTIGRGAIIAAGCVVTKDVIPYSVVGGVPEGIIKWRFKEEICERLMLIDWSQWDDERIKNAIPYMYNSEEFIRVYEEGKI